MSYDSLRRIEVYQPRDPAQFWDEEAEEPTDEEMFHDLRDIAAGTIDAEDLSHEDFGRLYNLVGAETIEVEWNSDEAALDEVWERWNNGSGSESAAFREMNRQERAVSLSSGHIVRVDGTAYLCDPIGWSELEIGGDA